MQCITSAFNREREREREFGGQFQVLEKQLFQCFFHSIQTVISMSTFFSQPFFLFTCFHLQEKPSLSPQSTHTNRPLHATTTNQDGAWPRNLSEIRPSHVEAPKNILPLGIFSLISLSLSISKPQMKKLKSIGVGLLSIVGAFLSKLICLSLSNVITFISILL